MITPNQPAPPAPPAPDTAAADAATAPQLRNPFGPVEAVMQLYGSAFGAISKEAVNATYEKLGHATDVEQMMTLCQMQYFNTCQLGELTNVALAQLRRLEQIAAALAALAELPEHMKRLADLMEAVRRDQEVERANESSSANGGTTVPPANGTSQPASTTPAALAEGGAQGAALPATP